LQNILKFKYTEKVLQKFFMLQIDQVNHPNAQ